ncbi:hypothetical protein [Spirillospora sp. NPDC047279]|uniref:hypothetical protein n=1 Tax=Spirillospora sp. NPDC047279 TaxID=3155478 RepID=UPI00340D3794
MKFTKRLRTAGVVSCAAVLTVGVWAAPAHAAIAECTVFYAWTTCSTPTIPANAGLHFVDVFTHESFPPNPICNAGEIRWKLIDADNGVVVGSGSGDTRTRIGGLYGRYYGRLDTCPRMRMAIDNTD